VDLTPRIVRHYRRPTRCAAPSAASIGYRPQVDHEGPGAGVPPGRRALYAKIGVAGFAFGNAMLFSIPRYVNGAPLEPAFQALFGALNLMLAVPVLLYSASDYFRSSWQSLRHRTMSLDVPVALGLAALFGRTVFEIGFGRGDGFADSFTGLVFFLLIGRLFQQRAFDRIAFDRTFRSFLPLAIRVESRDTGRDVMVPIEHVRAGDCVHVRPGEIVPADAMLLDEQGAIDLSFISGESTPVTARRHDVVPAGGRVVGRALRLLVRSDVEHSRLARLWNRAQVSTVRVNDLTAVAARFGTGSRSVRLGWQPSAPSPGGPMRPRPFRWRLPC
jgi:Cu+-exporting ATPase